MGKVIKFPVRESNLRLLVMDDEGNILQDIKGLDTIQLQQKLRELHYDISQNALYHIKVCREEHIVLNVLFIPYESNEQKIMQKVVMG